MNRVELFKKYPNKKFVLNSVNEINCNFPHRYKVTFLDIESNEDYETEILPEDLRGHFVIGNTYLNGKLIQKVEEKTKLYVPINKVTSKNLRKIGDCISYTHYLSVQFDNQNCIVYKTKKTIFLIPCYLIANRYYFLSTYIKTALSDGSFETLFYENDPKKFNGKGYKFVNDDLYIYLKAIVTKEHAPLISRMITDEVSSKNFKYFFEQTSNHLRSNPEQPYKSIIMGFPFSTSESLELYSYYIDLGNIFYSEDSEEIFDERNAVILTHIYKDKVSYNYKNLHPEYRTKEIEETKKTINQDDSLNFPRENPDTTNNYTTTRPSSSYTSRNITQQVENIYDFSDINIVFKENKEKLKKDVFDYGTDEFVDDSSEKEDSNSSKNKTRKLMIKDSLTKNCFNINNFKILLELFINKYKIDDFYISELVGLNNLENSKINKYFIDLEKEEERKFIYGYFNYNHSIINFIEIEHNIYWEKNTWYFISSRTFTELDVQNILNIYILKNQSTKKMLEDNKTKGALKFFMTRHENIKIENEKSIENWCENLKLGIKRCNRSKK